MSATTELHLASNCALPYPRQNGGTANACNTSRKPSRVQGVTSLPLLTHSHHAPLAPSLPSRSHEFPLTQNMLTEIGYQMVPRR